MTTNTNSTVVVLGEKDLLQESKGKEFVTTKDFNEKAHIAALNADVAIYQDDAEVRTILVFNMDLVESFTAPELA